jgi:hypothetical protein
MVWRDLADNAKYGPVEMAIDSAVGMFAGIHTSLSLLSNGSLRSLM